MKFKILVGVEIRDKNGKVVKRIHKECKSYVRQMIDILRAFHAQSNGSIRDTSNALQTIGMSNQLGFRLFFVNAEAANDAFGSVVGTGLGDVGISQYHLDAQIYEGVSANHLQHGFVSVGTVAIVGSSAQYTIARTFTNSSGALITVNEVGLYISFMDYGGMYRYAMIERSLLSFDIDNGASATVTYTIKVTV